MELKGQELKQRLIMGRAAVTLSPYVPNIDLISRDHLAGVCSWRGMEYPLAFKYDRLLSRLTRELIRLEPAVIGERIRIESIQALIIALYAPAKSLIPQLRMEIKKRAGLFRDKRLRNKAISAKILSGRFLRTKGVIKS